ncbi:MAG TPA: hypothetical protein VNV88_07345 [Candidatus Solibacter sp.]|jgi:hypothetical protein|nr:hypothetical protein [Candidatus Solibacter sp.]
METRQSNSVSDQLTQDAKDYNRQHEELKALVEKDLDAKNIPELERSILKVIIDEKVQSHKEFLRLKLQPTFRLLDESFDRRERQQKVTGWYQWAFLGAGLVFTFTGIVCWFYTANHLPANPELLRIHPITAHILQFVSRLLFVGSIGAIAANFFQLHRATVSEFRYYVRLRMAADAKRALYFTFRANNQELKPEYVQPFANSIVEIVQATFRGDPLPPHSARAADNPLDAAKLIKDKIDPYLEMAERVKKISKE